jgi:hypothetical protein
MGAVLVVGPAPVELERRREGPDFIEILKEASERSQLRQEADFFSSVCGDIGADLRLIKEIDPVVYLVDFDVIRSLIDLKPQDPEEQRQALRIFENPNFQYALPVGAFSELLWWLRGFAPTYGNWLPKLPVADGNRREALEQLAHAVNVWPDNPDERELIREIAVAAARLTDITRVLITFLDRKNFHAVFSEYDESTRISLQEILAKLQRRDPDQSRGMKDLRDSQSLAVVCRRAELRDQITNGPSPNSKKPESFVLLTQTAILLDLVRRLDSQQDRQSVLVLSRLFKRPEVTRKSEERILYPSGYPVMTPQRAFFVEELRRDGVFPAQSRSMLEEMKVIFGRLAHVLEEPDTPFEQLPLVAREQKVALLQACVNELSKYEENRFYRALFVDRLLSGQKGESRIEESNTPRPGNRLVDRDAGLVLAESTVEYFYRSMVALNKKINAIAPTTYELKQELHPSLTFKELTVASKQPEENVMQGELYLDYPGGQETAVAFSFRWRTIARERRFFACLQGIFAVASDYGTNPLPQVFSVTPMTGDKVPPPEGLLYFTSIGVFWAPLLESFIPLARGIRISDKLKHAIAVVAKVPLEEIEILAVRVQTVFGDFQLDLIEDGEGIREVFVITQHNIGEQIAYICESTSLLGVLPDRLNQVLQEITSQFPSYSSSKKTGDAP